jgi:hypothetical protein
MIFDCRGTFFRKRSPPEWQNGRTAEWRNGGMAVLRMSYPGALNALCMSSKIKAAVPPFPMLVCLAVGKASLDWYVRCATQRVISL